MSRNGFHISPNTREPEECNAKKDSCPFGGIHYKTMAEANKALETVYAHEAELRAMNLKKNAELKAKAKKSLPGKTAAQEIKLIEHKPEHEIEFIAPINNSEDDFDVDQLYANEAKFGLSDADDYVNELSGGADEDDEDFLNATATIEEDEWVAECASCDSVIGTEDSPALAKAHFDDSVDFWYCEHCWENIQKELDEDANADDFNTTFNNDSEEYGNPELQVESELLNKYDPVEACDNVLQLKTENVEVETPKINIAELKSTRALNETTIKKLRRDLLAKRDEFDELSNEYLHKTGELRIFISQAANAIKKSDNNAALDVLLGYETVNDEKFDLYEKKENVNLEISHLKRKISQLEDINNLITLKISLLSPNLEVNTAHPEADEVVDEFYQDDEADDDPDYDVWADLIETNIREVA